jgi:hypothetical protein
MNEIKNNIASSLTSEKHTWWRIDRNIKLIRRAILLIASVLTTTNGFDINTYFKNNRQLVGDIAET